MDAVTPIFAANSVFVSDSGARPHAQPEYLGSPSAIPPAHLQHSLGHGGLRVPKRDEIALDERVANFRRFWT